MKPLRVLLQTTIAPSEDDWHIGRFSLLRDTIASVEGVEVTARDRGPVGTADPILSTLGESTFDQLWLIAVDYGDGLTDADVAGIRAFAKRGGGIVAMRDHENLGSSLCRIGGVGEAHYFHDGHVDPDATRCGEDNVAASVSWPNYLSGDNGNFQRIHALVADHPLLKRGDGSTIEWLPAHPHEGGIGVPAGATEAKVVATGKSRATSRTFNLIVAFDPKPGQGRAIAESSFHHLVDYNWNPGLGCPSFLTDPPGDEFKGFPERLEDVRAYVRNAVRWLART